MQAPRVTLLDQPSRWERVTKKVGQVAGKVAAAVVGTVLVGTVVAVVVLLCGKLIYVTWTWVFG